MLEKSTKPTFVYSISSLVLSVKETSDEFDFAEEPLPDVLRIFHHANFK